MRETIGWSIVDRCTTQHTFTGLATFTMWWNQEAGHDIDVLNKKFEKFDTWYPNYSDGQFILSDKGSWRVNSHWKLDDHL